MQNLRLLERLFPDALFVHLIRDGRTQRCRFSRCRASSSRRRGCIRVRRPTSHASGARRLWPARRLGGRVGPRYIEVRYEDLVENVEAVLRRICEFAGLDFEPAMADYAGNVDVSGKPHQQRLLQPPTSGLRDWRTQMRPVGRRGIRACRGRPAGELGYETSHDADLSGRVRRVSYTARALAWRGASFALRRSFLWRRRHPALR